MPHTCTESALLIVTLLDTDGKEHQISTRLTGDTWRPGYLVTYVISLTSLRSGYELNILSTPDPMEHNTVNSSGTFGINSYSQRMNYSPSDPTPTEGTGGQLDFSVVGYSFDGTASTDLAQKPDWLNFGSFQREGDGKAYTVNFQFAPQQYDTSRPNGNHRETLQGNTRKTGVDLSAQDPNGNYFTAAKARESANCYIVNRPGTYRFPLVYGNALQINGSAQQYYDFSTQTTFVDHAGNAIRHGWIRQQLAGEPVEKVPGVEDTWLERTVASGYVYRAAVLWQEAPRLLRNVALDAQDNDYIIFEVDEDDIQPGNAVIALWGCAATITTTVLTRGAVEATGVEGVNSTRTEQPDELTTVVTRVITRAVVGGYQKETVEERTVVDALAEWQVLWSWHIWLTDEVYPNRQGDPETSIAVGSGADRVMPVCLGWVPDEMRWGSYSKREVWVTFKQNTTNNAVVQHFVQHARPDLLTGHTTLYQWGRPTALPMLVRNATDTATVVRLYDGSGAEIPAATRCTFASGASLSDAIQQPMQMLAAWSPAAALWSATTKTPYDPCPAGFRMPAASLFSFAARDAVSPVADAASLNLWADGTNTSGQTVRNGAPTRGGYFYASPTNSERYGTYVNTEGDLTPYTYVPNPSMLYLPATGWWPAAAVGTPMSDALAADSRQAARYWTADADHYLFLLPDRQAAGVVADWTSPFDAHATSMAVRPMGQVLSE